MRAETKELYPDNWLEISRTTIETRGNRCEKCHRTPGDHSIILTTHHWNHDPSNVDGYNLVVHCQACHLDQERGSNRSFGVLRNEFYAFAAGQLWLTGMESPYSKSWRAT